VIKSRTTSSAWRSSESRSSAPSQSAIFSSITLRSRIIFRLFGRSMPARLRTLRLGSPGSPREPPVAVARLTSEEGPDRLCGQPVPGRLGPYQLATAAGRTGCDLNDAESAQPGAALRGMPDKLAGRMLELRADRGRRDQVLGAYATLRGAPSASQRLRDSSSAAADDRLDASPRGRRNEPQKCRYGTDSPPLAPLLPAERRLERPGGTSPGTPGAC